MNNRNKRSDPDSELYSAILKLQTVEECYDFFTDLCTFSELKAMEQRFELAKLLNDGLIYNDILEKTGASSATISRVNRSLNYGMGAYRIIFDRMKEDEQKQQEEPGLTLKRQSSTQKSRFWTTFTTKRRTRSETFPTRITKTLSKVCSILLPKTATSSRFQKTTPKF